MPAETLKKSSRSFSKRSKPPSDSVGVLPQSRLVRAVSVWLSINFFQAVSQVSGLSGGQRALQGDWHYVIAILASLGLLSLVFVLLRQSERAVEFLAARSPAVVLIVKRAFVGALIALCIAAPLVQWWAVGYADRLREVQPNPSIERTCVGGLRPPMHAAHVER